MARMTATETPSVLESCLVENVKREMREREMTQLELAEKLQITRPQLSKLLARKNRLQLYWAERFAMALEIGDPRELLQNPQKVA